MTTHSHEISNATKSKGLLGDFKDNLKSMIALPVSIIGR